MQEVAKVVVKIDSQPVDARILQTWKEAVAHHDVAEVQAFVSAQPHLRAGFRKGKVSLPVAVRRIQSMLDQSCDLPTDLRLLLRDATLSQALLSVLSEEAIYVSLPSLATAFGRARIYAAMLLDERESIRTLGFDQVADWDGAEPTDLEHNEAVENLGSLLRKFFDQIQPLVGGSALASQRDVPATTVLVGRHDSRTGKLVANLRQKRQEANRLRRELLDTKSERDKANSQVQTLTVSLAASTSALNSKTQALDDLSGRFEERVRQAVKRQLDDRLLPWLRPAEAFAQAVAESMQGDLLQEAEALLQRQASIDQRFGLRSQLEAEAVRCKDFRLRLKEAVKESIQPLPEIGSLVRKLERRIAEIEKILQQTAFVATPAGQAPPLLIQKLQHATTLDELASVRKGLIAIESIGLLAPPELSAAYALIGDKASRLYLQAGLGKPPKSQMPSLKGVPLYALRRQLADGHSCTLLIDGHNVLHKLPTLFGEHFERGDPGTEAQQALIQKIDALCTLHENLTVDLWFDSGRAHDETMKSNFNVHYSGGKGANRADDQIVAYLQYLSRQSPQQFRALVTADRDEAAKAEDCGALIVSPLEFAVMIR